MKPKSRIAINAQITICVQEDSVRIELIDKDASVTFFEGEMTHTAFVNALARLGCVGMENATVCGLDRIGKRMEHKTIEFQFANSTTIYANEKDLALKEMPRYVPEGWVSDGYFGSQRSFFDKDGKRWARCTVRRWVDK